MHGFRQQTCCCSKIIADVMVYRNPMPCCAVLCHVVLQHSGIDWEDVARQIGTRSARQVSREGGMHPFKAPTNSQLSLTRSHHPWSHHLLACPVLPHHVNTRHCQCSARVGVQGQCTEARHHTCVLNVHKLTHQQCPYGIHASFRPAHAGCTATMPAHLTDCYHRCRCCCDSAVTSGGRGWLPGWMSPPRSGPLPRTSSW